MNILKTLKVWALVARAARTAVNARNAALVVALGSAIACQDSTGPRDPRDIVEGAALLPAVEDARLRLVPVIQNLGVRDRIAYDMQQMEAALQKKDGHKARYHLRVAGGILMDYRAGLAGVTTDGPDVGGIALMLHAVSVAAGGTFDIDAFR